MKTKKKQFRLYDIYRYATLGKMSKIYGIHSYECNINASTIVIRFEDATGEYKQGLAYNYFANDENDLKEIVRNVNKRLGNCRKPGRVRRIK